MNDAPVATPLANQSMSDGTAITSIDVGANFSDAEGDTLTFTVSNLPPGLAFDPATGVISGTPASDASQPSQGGPTYNVTVTASDGNGGSTPLSFDITVANLAPTASTIAAQSNDDADSVAGFDVSGSFTDPDGDTLAFSAAGLPTGFTISPAGVISGTIDRRASQAGPASDGVFEVDVTATDNQGGSVTERFSWAVTNPGPVAQPDDVFTPEDTALNGDVLANNGNGPDSDPDGDPLTVTTTPVSGPSNGTLTLRTDGTFTYTPNLNFEGSDSFTYEVTDEDGASAQAVVSISVTGDNDRPASTPLGDQAASDGEAVAGIDLSGNFSDPDAGDALSFTATGLPPGLSISGAGVISGTVQTGASTDVGGPDYSVTVRATDNAGAFTEQTFTYRVTNLPPVARDDAFTVLEDGVLNTGNVLGDNGSGADADTAPDADALSVDTTPVSGPANGTLTLNTNGTFTYTPNADYAGPDSFVYTPARRRRQHRHRHRFSIDVTAGQRSAGRGVGRRCRLRRRYCPGRCDRQRHGHRQRPRCTARVSLVAAGRRDRTGHGRSRRRRAVRRARRGPLDRRCHQRRRALRSACRLHGAPDLGRLHRARRGWRAVERGRDHPG